MKKRSTFPHLILLISLIAAVYWLPTRSLAQPQRLASLIGNSAYSGNNFFANQVNDARDFDQLYEDFYFKVEAQPSKIFRDRLQDGNPGPEMVRIEAGSFRMGDLQGSGYFDEKPVHLMSVNRFAMSRYEVTVGEFRRFVTTTRYRTDAEKGNGCSVYVTSLGRKKDANWRKPYFSQNDNHPVVCVSWNDATAYAVWLSRQTGQTYRLPTEAEWEYAARAGTTTSRYWGNNPDEACHYANVHDNTSKQENGFSWQNHNCTDGYAKTAPVGHFQPNAFGLFDMLGNVWEWACSEYQDQYSGKESKCISQNSGRLRVRRGGAWGYEQAYVRVAYRDWGLHDYRDYDIGFRLVRFNH